MDVPMEEEEEEFTDEFALTDRVYPWASLHTPRKPKYYNRVRKGTKIAFFNFSFFQELIGINIIKLTMIWRIFLLQL
jgi:hypothetical protein